jgi:hypothetical protein
MDLPTTPDTPAVVVHTKTHLHRPLVAPALAALPIRVVTEVEQVEAAVVAQVAQELQHRLALQRVALESQVLSRELPRSMAEVAEVADTSTHLATEETAGAAQAV